MAYHSDFHVYIARKKLTKHTATIIMYSYPKVKLYLESEYFSSYFKNEQMPALYTIECIQNQ